MFTHENTSGYSDADLPLLNAELADRLATVPDDEFANEECARIEKAFSDEVGHGWLESRIA